MKTGLVLEGGALRTIYSSGVCDGLLDGNIMPDYVVGVSAGIAYGVSYVSRQRGRNLEILLKYGNDKRYMSKRNFLHLQNRSYFGLDFAYDEIPNQLVPFDYKAYDAFPGEVEAVMTNLRTGRPMYLPVPSDDKQFQILRATCALPLLFPVIKIEGQPCLDGGVADAIPYRRAFAKGCDRAIVVLTRERSYVRQAEKMEPVIDRCYRRYPKFCDTMHRRVDAYNECRQKLFQMEREGKVFLFAPDSTLGFSRTEKDVEKIKALWQQGVDHAGERMEQLNAFLQQDAVSSEHC